MDAFGNFWRQRNEFQVSSTVVNDIMNINLLANNDLLYGDVSLVIENGQDLQGVFVVTKPMAEVLSVEQTNWADNDLLITISTQNQ